MNDTAELWISLAMIKKEFPGYRGEWPISYWCWHNQDKLENTKIYITDKHGSDVWDFYVPDARVQADFYLHNIYKRKSTGDHD